MKKCRNELKLFLLNIELFFIQMKQSEKTKVLNCHRQNLWIAPEGYFPVDCEVEEFGICLETKID